MINTVENSNLSNVHILIMLPQIFFLTLGSIISFISALEFAYSESPKNLHTIIAAFWFLTNSIGNITVITNVGLFSLEV